MSWNEAKPIATDVVSDLAGVLRSQKTAFTSGIEKHFYWSDSTTSAGIARISATSGAWRAFSGTSSLVSSNETGRAFYDTTNDRLYVLSPSLQALVGSRTAVIVQPQLTQSQQSSGARWVTRSGSSTSVSAGTYRIQVDKTINPVYQQAPVIELTQLYSSGLASTATESYLLGASSVSSGGFILNVQYVGASVDGGSCGFYWRSIGTSAL